MKREYFIVFFVIVISLFVSFLPTVHHILRTPNNTVHTLGYNFYPDYFQFVSWMRDGGEGHLALTSRFTPEEFPRKFGHSFFSLFGFFSSQFRVDYFASYTVGRIVLGFFRLFIAYIFISIFFKRTSQRTIALLCVIVLPSFYTLVSEGGVWSIRYFLPGITNFDIFRRLTFLPHHLFSAILMMVGILAYGSALQRNSFRYSALASLLFFIASLVNPATILSMGSTLILSFFVLLFLKHRIGWVILISHFVVAFFGIIVSILYLRFYLFTVFPWDLFLSNDVAKLRWPFLDYIGALGWALPFGILGVILSKKYYHSIFFVLLVSWAFGPIGGVFLSEYMPQISSFRLFQAQQAIPLGILSAMGLVGLYVKFKRHSIIAVILLIVFLTSVPYVYTSWKEQWEDAAANNYYLYLPQSAYEAFTYLSKNTKRESVVLAGYYSGQLLPAFSHNRVLVGHMDGTYEYEKKLDLMTKFYSGNFSSSDMQSLVENNHISYFYFGPDTPLPVNSSLKSYPNVKLVYENEGNFIYEVVK